MKAVVKYTAVSLLTLSMSTLESFVNDAFSQVKDDGKFHITLSGDVKLLRSPDIYRFSDYPADMRFVPIHPDDSLVPPANNDTIMDRQLSLEYGFAHVLDIRIGAARAFNNNIWGFGVGIEWNPQSGLLRSEETVAERDYLKNPGSSNRGYGTALTYYTSYFRGVKPVMYAQYSRVLYKEAAGGFFFDLKYEGVFAILRMENGHDRWDAYTAYRKEDIGLFLNNNLTAEASLRIFTLLGSGSLGFYVGYTVPVQLSGKIESSHTEPWKWFSFGVPIRVDIDPKK